MWFWFILYLTLWRNQISIGEEIPDIEYEQVIADRYLFSPFSNESTTWSVLHNVRSAWQVVSLPEYHPQASEGVWLLIEREQTNAVFEVCYMPLAANGSLINLSKINVTNNGSFLVSSHNKNRIEDYTAALISPNDIKLILCDQSDATSCVIKRIIPFPSTVSERTKKISSGLFISDLGSMGYLYIGSDSGLHGLNLQTFEIIPYINGLNVPVSSIAWSEKYKTIFIGTATKLWFETYINGTQKWRFEHVTGLIDDPISSLVYDNTGDTLWIGQDTGITLFSPKIMLTGRVHWYFSRLAGHISNPGSYTGHLPYANITSLSVTNSNPSDGCVWLGSIYGLMRYDPNGNENNLWRVFNSARYMPNRLAQVDISSLTVLNRIKNAPKGLGSTAIAITNRGLSVIRFEMWTLAKKAEHFQKFIDDSNRHVRYGFVSDCAISTWGDPRTCVKGPNDNDGLWTTMYLSSQIFRYAITNDSSVRKTAWEHFQALYLLNQVTGIPGYPARSLAKKNEFPPTEDWYPSPINSTLQFKGDTSSDEIVGHEFVYPLVHDLLCENDGERLQAYTLILNITTHILTHNWYLIGENHNHTTWGIWNPNEMNNNSLYQETRGLNSLQILTFLLQTYGYTGDERFLDGANLLIDLYEYDINLINQKMIAVCDGDFSDDELAYLSYFNLVYAFHTIHLSKKLSSKQKENVELVIKNLQEYMLIGLELSHKYKQMEKSPFYNFIYCYAINQTNIQSFGVFDCNSLSKDSIWYLQRMPLELINWPQFNGNRLDIELNREAFCSRDGIGTLRLLPPDERSFHKWNGGVFDLGDGDAMNEDDPTIFLIGYWGMRYFNLLGV